MADDHAVRLYIPPVLAVMCEGCRLYSFRKLRRMAARCVRAAQLGFGVIQTRDRMAGILVVPRGGSVMIMCISGGAHTVDSVSLVKKPVA